MERQADEAAARKARREAQAYLAQHSCGPSQRELERTNHSIRTTTRAPEGDNTLEVLAARQRKKAKLEGTTTASPAYQVGPDQSKKVVKWRQVKDSASGEVYYWNSETDETKWTMDDEENVNASQPATDDDADALPKGWEAVTDPQTGDTYYWNQESNATTWDKPQFEAVSIAEAQQARVKLDQILEQCGKR